MKNNKIETQYGHLTIAPKKFWENLAVDQITDKMIQDPEQLRAKIQALPEVKFASSRLAFYGLANTDDKSIPSHIIGFDPSIESGMQSHLLFTEGASFSERKSVIVGTGLAKLLKVKPGQEFTLVSPTLDGGINAMDVTVTGIFSTGFSDIDNETIFINLSDAEKVLDTNYVQQILINLKDERSLESIGPRIESLISSNALQLKTWRDQAELYIQVENFYIFQNVVIEFILLALLILSVANTTNMTIFERLGEIGTLRALGDYEFDIQKIFLIESVFLGLLAIAIGIPVSYLLLQAISSLNIELVLPFASRAVTMKLIPLPAAFLEASLVCFFSIVVATIWPAKKGSHIPIVAALRAKV